MDKVLSKKYKEFLMTRYHRGIELRVHLCDEVRLRAWLYQPNGQPLKYNPRITPNWDLNWRNVDGQHFDFIYSVGNKLFVK